MASGRFRSPADRLGHPALAPLVDELSRRYESGSAPVRIRVPNLAEAGERALADLLGLDRYLAQGGGAGRTRTLAVARLATALGGDLRPVVEELRGPLRDRFAERDAHTRRREALWAWLGSRVAGLPIFSCPESAQTWVDRVRRSGVPGGDVDTHRRRLEVAVQVLCRLPAGGVTLASLAADVTGDAHVLDAGRRIGRLVVDALAVSAGVETGPDGAAVRALWERVGVIVDPLSSTALILGLRSGGSHPLATMLATAANAGEPVVVTLSQLARWPFFPTGETRSVLVVENPAVVNEAATAGFRVPMLCTGGWPSVAALTLLRPLLAAGIQVYQHADFDPAGLRITSWLQVHLGTTPWQMTAGAYRGGLDLVPDSPPVVGDIPDTPWEPTLAELMRRERRAIHEEAIRHHLLAAMAERQVSPPKG